MAGCFETGDTIVAVSSPPGGAWRGVVRLSGPSACPLAECIFRPELPPSSTGEWITRKVEIIGPDGCFAPGRCLVMRAPRSYTREDVVEIHTTGAPPLLTFISNKLVECGARPAGPGEFTMRAYLNGRIDLPQAEAVCRVISSRTEGEYRKGQRALSGEAGGTLRRVGENLLSLRSQLEAELNWPEEDDVKLLSENGLREALSNAYGQLSVILESTPREEGRIRIVLSGKTNCGKSTLFNALLEGNRAVVSDIDGTTTDAVTGELELAGMVCTLVDTAGSGGAPGRLWEAAGRARDRELELADIVVCLVDLSSASVLQEAKRLKSECKRQCIVAGTKSDTLSRQSLNELEERLIPVSGLKGWGLDKLRAEVEKKVQQLDSGNRELVTVRQKEAVQRALSALKRAEAECRRRELCALEIRCARQAIREVLGETVDEDLLGEIFSNFCIGK